MIKCTTCDIEKDTEWFSFRNKALDIRHSVCKECQNKATKLHYAANKEIYKERAASWATKNKSLRRAVSREHCSRVRTDNVWKECTRSEFLQFYQNCPENYDVDHILSLTDGGCHCINNLQYLSHSEHRYKTWQDKRNRA